MSAAQVSPGRVSIRESLRIFRVIEEHLVRRKADVGLFEQLVSSHNSKLTGRSTSSDSVPERSCGGTNLAFANLFFSRKQLRSNAASLATNGSPLEALTSNPNIAFWSLRQLALTRRTGVQSWMAGYFGRVASRQVDALSEILLQPDRAHELPRVLFCNCSWVLYNNNHVAVDMEQDTEVKDHQFSIIKHGTDCFQIVQGYISSAEGNHADTDSITNDNAASSSGGEAISALKGGLYLSEWQNQTHAVEPHEEHGGRYASRNGFNAGEMATFLAGLRAFSCPSAFDAPSYKSMFGVFESGSQLCATYPAVSFRELLETDIDGFGERLLAESIEKEIDRTQCTLENQEKERDYLH